MPITDILPYFQHPLKEQFINKLIDSKIDDNFTLTGLQGSSLSLLATSAFQHTNCNYFFIFPDRDKAAFFYHDIEKLLEEEDKDLKDRQVHYFPSSYNRLYSWEEPDVTHVKLRTELIDKLLNGDQNLIIITYPEAVAEKLVSDQYIRQSSFTLKVGERTPSDILLEFLYSYHYKQEDFVFEPGQFAWRGAIFDIFSYAEEYPLRIELEDDIISSMRYFDAGNQLSIREVSQAHIIPDIVSEEAEKKVSFFNYITPNSRLWLMHIDDIRSHIEDLYTHIEEHDSDKINVSDHFIDGSEFLRSILDYSVIEINSSILNHKTFKYSFGIKPQHHFAKNFNLLLDEWVENYEHGIQNIFLSDNVHQHDRISKILGDILSHYNHDHNTQYYIGEIFTSITGLLHEGFQDEQGKLCVYTDHQFFEKYHRFTIRDRYKKSEVFTLREIYDLQPGDYVVHVDHGIGIYQGLAKMEVNGREQEVIKLSYKEGDILYISIHSLHKITKYVGKEGTVPSLHRLGSGVWERSKERTKNRVKELIIDLVKLYAKRKTRKGFAYSPDSYLQTELEASFLYEDTPDQLKTTQEVKRDMENDIPMERLICGDVGFGKTEIAIRAAFKAVCDSKQVAVLVPTTVLALQHYNTFMERLKKFPCNINYLNRFKSNKEIKEIVESLKKGQIDIIIGTHRLLSKDIEFKDLGLLIIDEEQKFGVAAKEKLREMRTEVDTLTMSATPIPRTLQFSLMGVRDISVIATPPPNRYPIQTEVHGFDEELIREAITFEISRSGQVFFVNNKVQNIYEIADMIRRLVPDAKIGIGHGQMEGPQLEKVMLDFINGKYDVLVATTIVESGLDITNANTMIINDAQNYALNVLHQLRGRVGRNNKKAFCYLLVKSMNTLNDNAKKRLKAIEDFSEIGSGFQIAMRDLDIRGAGDILGAEQSGFINEMGFEMYQKILSEAILELQDTEVGMEMADTSTLIKRECQIETDLGLQIPAEYVSSVSERMSLYKELDNIITDEELEKFRKKLLDIFGGLPNKTEELLKIIPLKRICIENHLEKVVLKNGNFTGYFYGSNDTQFFQSEHFTRILQLLQKYHPQIEMREVNNKLQLIIKKVPDISSAIMWLSRI